jgi:hypothetical protein
MLPDISYLYFSGENESMFKDIANVKKASNYKSIQIEGVINEN